uniref:Peroxisomal-coenzyme A synthetase n=1 Tax=Lygus hesperus TaxID=30085 RepID=A0A0A9VTX8_LYGHE
MDDEGFIRITGRLKELINRGGEKIAPSEIDEVMLEHPSVAEAVAFGAPDRMYGQVVYAAVVLRPNSNRLTQQDLQVFMRTKLSDFKIPQKIFFTDSLPRTATGKLQRRFVAEHFLAKRSKL